LIEESEGILLRIVSNNQITLLQNGEAYFPAMETALDKAIHEIYLESYIFENDNTGRRIAEALRRAASRGVKTHVLIDGFGSNGLPKTMVEFLEGAGVMVLKFRPRISPWTLKRQRLRRLHRKMVVVDQQIAFVGGINIIDDMSMPAETSPRYDYAVSVEGPLVKEIHDSARRVWRRVARTRLRLRWGREKERPAASSGPMGRMRAAFLVRDNIRHRRDIEDAYLQAIEQAKIEIILANAYFFPGLNFRHALLDAARRGVRVILLMQGKVEYRLLYYASHALYGSFLDAGIKIYEYHKSLMHAKVAVIDEHWATVGSSNLDPLSLLLALEANVVVVDEDFAGNLKGSLEAAIKAGARRVFKRNWRTQTFGIRLASWLSYGLVRFMTGMTGYAHGETIRANINRAKSAQQE
jgi:cardiolipin synthase A/B